MFRVFSSRDRDMGRWDGGRGGYYDPHGLPPGGQDMGSFSRPGYQGIPPGMWIFYAGLLPIFT